MDLATHYNNLYQDSIAKIKANCYEIDELINDTSDDRLGVTLLAKPSEEVQANVASFLNELQAIEPKQYYHPIIDLHTTLLSIISCYSGFELSQIKPLAYQEKIEEALTDIGPFQINYRGITASPSCILIQGFPKNDTLSQLRANLREVFKSSNLQHSIDSRYALKTAHMTVVRFQHQFENKEAFLQKIEAYRDFDFGTTTVKELFFVCNDWYQKNAIVKTLSSFTLY